MDKYLTTRVTTLTNALISDPSSPVDVASAGLCVGADFKRLADKVMKNTKTVLTDEFSVHIADMRVRAGDQMSTQQSVLHDTDKLCVTASVASPQSRLDKKLLLDALVRTCKLSPAAAQSLIDSCMVESMPALTLTGIAKSPISRPQRRSQGDS